MPAKADPSIPTAYEPSDADRAFMRRALELAKRGEGYVEPNPMVGCVLVKGGEIIGEGFHGSFGGPHAEVEALRSATNSPVGATAYVTLEPCSYRGKTPPCVDALIDADIARVVAATIDPNPQVGGRGVRRLRAAKVRVEVGLCEREACRLIAPFRRMMIDKRPFVIAKWAQSLDGKLATHTGDARWITGEQARRHVHRVRGRVDALVVGVKTVIADDPELTCRDAAPRRVATRVVVDPQLRTPPAAKLVRTAREAPTLIITSSAAKDANRKRLTDAGCQILAVRSTREGVSIPGMLKLLAGRGMTNVLFEGGGDLLGRLFDAHRRSPCVDECHMYVAPLLVGGQDAVPAIGGIGPAQIADALRLTTPPRQRRLGDDMLFIFRVGDE